MRIGVDISDLATMRADGTTRYIAELARRLPEVGTKHEWVYLAPFASPAIRKVSVSTKVKVRLSPWHRFWTQSRLPFDLYRERLDVLFMPIQQLPYVRPKRMKTVAVMHDLAVHRFPQQFTRKDWLLLHVFSAQAARQADALIAVSQATADDVARYYGRRDQVAVIHHGVDHERFRTAHTEQERRAAWQRLQQWQPKLSRPYILYVGQIQPRKNLIRLVEAFERLRDSTLQLVLAGGYGWLQEPTLRRIHTSAQRERILMLGTVPDELLPGLYWNASVFILPSLYEGFGMPILEAFACGCPVVAANVSALPEVANDAAVLIDPDNAENIVRGIRLALDQPAVWQERGLRRVKQFSWDTAARETLHVIESAGYE